MVEKIVSSDDEGVRLDRWLKRECDMPQSLAQKLLRLKKIRLNGVRAETSTRVSAGDVVKLPDHIKDTAEVQEHFGPKKAAVKRVPKPKKHIDFDLDILFEDEHLMIINKPYGLAVQGGTSVDISLDDILQQMTPRPLLVHRLDRDTSGVLVLAKSSKIARDLTRMFQGKDMQKIYHALVVGVLRPQVGKFDMPLGQGEGASEKMYVDPENGQRALTEYRVIESFGMDLCLVELSPITGRKHQLRVHLSHVHHPIIGDGKYGGKDAHPLINGREKHKMHLHARRILFRHPITGEKLNVQANYPDHIKDSFTLLGLSLKQ